MSTLPTESDDSNLASLVCLPRTLTLSPSWSEVQLHSLYWARPLVALQSEWHEVGVPHVTSEAKLKVTATTSLITRCHDVKKPRQSHEGRPEAFMWKGPEAPMQHQNQIAAV